MATVVGICSWCRSARWQYKCSTCDPRKEKTLCSNCSMLWHSRGFARTHQLTSSYGETRSYSSWGLQPEHGVRNGNDSAGQPVASENRSRDVGGAQAPEVAGNREGDTNAEESTEEFDFEVVGESVDSGEDTMSVEEVDELEEKAKNASVEELADGKQVETSNSDAKADEQSETKHQEEITLQTTSSAIAAESKTPNSATLSTVSTVPVSAPPSSSSDTVPATSVSDSAAPDKKPTTTAAAGQPRTGRIAQPKPVDLEKLLRWFPTTDPVLMNMLASRVEEALVIEDALICARIGKCEEPSCRSVLLHYEHCKHNEVCSDPKCSEISIVYRHRQACSKKDNSSASDDKKVVCPFCIRIRQRRSLGLCAALDHLISDQRRALQGAHSEANRNFCLQSINTWKQRKQLHREEIERFNQLASESSAPIFNFPKYQWHFSDSVFIKREPTSLETSVDPATAAQSSTDNNLETPTEQRSEMQVDVDNKLTPDDDSSAQRSQDTQEDSIPGTASFNADFINQLLRIKEESIDNREMARQEFDGVMELGYAIVDASFCAPSKAQRCLLNCKSILDHLQHHLDLQVCKQAMCAAVEHHFAHLSQCKSRNESESCEYCLRVEERQLIRSVDFMEAEQPEAEAIVQKIINDITASFTNQSPDEREQELILLEDELDQAETNKQELLEKLGTARSNLRNVRRIMEQRGISTSTSRQLPVHFAKARRSEGSGSSKKRRLADSL